MAAMLAVEVNTDGQNPTPAVIRPGQKRRKTFFLVGCVLGGTLMMGVLFGALIASRVAHSDDFNPKCVDDIPSDVTSELDAGLNTIEVWFPESAATIRANKADIISQMVSFEDPPQDSFLQKVKLFTGKMARTTSSERRLTLGASPCVMAVTDFLVDFMQWVADWATVTILAERLIGPRREVVVAEKGGKLVIANKGRNGKVEILNGFEQFRFKLLQLNLRMEIFHFEEQVAIIMGFVLADGAAQKTRQLLKLIRWMFKLGGGPMKLLMQWINDHPVNPWEATKAVVMLAARLNLVFARKTFAEAPFVLAIMSTPSIIDNGKKTMSVCKRSMTPSGNSTNPLVADDSK